MKIHALFVRRAQPVGGHEVRDMVIRTEDR